MKWYFFRFPHKNDWETVQTSFSNLSNTLNPALKVAFDFPRANYLKRFFSRLQKKVSKIDIFSSKKEKDPWIISHAFIKVLVESLATSIYKRNSCCSMGEWLLDVNINLRASQSSQNAQLRQLNHVMRWSFVTSRIIEACASRRDDQMITSLLSQTIGRQTRAAGCASFKLFSSASLLHKTIRRVNERILHRRANASSGDFEERQK